MSIAETSAKQFYPTPVYRLLELYQEDGYQARRMAATDGGEYAGPCPSCGGDDRFRLWPEKGRWWCRGCGLKGDTPGYLMSFKGFSYPEALDFLGRQESHSAGGNGDKPAPQKTWSPLLPVPPDAGKVPDLFWSGTPHKRKPDASWPYKNSEGLLLGVVARWNTPGDKNNKDIRPVTFCLGPDGQRKWRLKSWPEPRPLYGLDRLAARPDAPVLIVEGEKTADAAQELLPDLVAITSPGGSKAAGKTDWSPLRGREVTIWPDADDPGKSYADKVAQLAREVGASNVKVVEVPEDFPCGWDLADEPPQEWDHDRLNALLNQPGPTQKPANPDQHEQETSDWPFRVSEDGVYKKVHHKDKNTGAVTTDQVRICSQLEVVAETRDVAGQNWGRLLAVTTREGQQHLWAMPMEMLAGDGNSYRGQLLSLGLEISPGYLPKQALQEYISTAQPQERARCVQSLGWHGQIFILPDATFGTGGEERVIFQSAGALDHPFHVSGSLVEWQDHLARYCVGNSRLAFAVASGFAAPLLHIAGLESGGFHLRGGSSIGKTTALHVAGSVWGGGGINGYCRSWRTTSNGLESIGASHCDTQLCLDEMSQIDGRQAGEVAYMLANGQGKSRARRDGSGRAPAQWRVLFLSTGELSLTAKMNEAGCRAQAGQEVRLVDIPADAGAGLGLFESLHDFENATAFADHLRRAAKDFYGTPIRAFLEKITSDMEGLNKELQQAIKTFLEKYCPSEADGQVRRVAARFGLVAAAGELAGALGILPWPDDEALWAAGACFSAWLEERGGTEPTEIMRGIAQVKKFFQNHGASRFEKWDGEDGRLVINRAGYVRDTAEGRQYTVFTEVFKNEIAAGYDAKRLARALVDRNLLVPDGNGRPSRPVRLPGIEKPNRMYVFTADIITEGAEDA